LHELNAIFMNDPSISVYGGRREAASLPIALDEQIQYLRKAYAIVHGITTGLGTKRVRKANPRSSGPQFFFRNSRPDASGRCACSLSRSTTFAFQ
jgi:hypothetical protein